MPVYEHTPAMRCYRSYDGHGYKVQWAFTRDGIRLHLVLTDWTSLGEAELWILKQEYNLPHKYGAVTWKTRQEDTKHARWVKRTTYSTVWQENSALDSDEIKGYRNIQGQAVEGFPTFFFSKDHQSPKYLTIQSEYFLTFPQYIYIYKLHRSTVK